MSIITRLLWKKRKTLRGRIVPDGSGYGLVIEPLDGGARIRIRHESALPANRPPLGSFVEVSYETSLTSREPKILGVKKISLADRGTEGEGLLEYHCCLDRGTQSGTIELDGRVIIVDKSTRIVGAIAPLVNESGVLDPGIWVRYRGVRPGVNGILATELELLSDPYAHDIDKLSRRVARIENVKAGKKVLHTLKRRFTLYPDENVQRYIESVGSSCLPSFYNEPELQRSTENRFRFFAVNLRYPNAFALPNGIIVVDAKLVRLLENEAQLAYILAHEIAHVSHRHSVRDATRAGWMDLPLALLDNLLPDGRLGWMIRFSAALAATAIYCRYSRESERQADRVALRYMISAGYDPREAPRAIDVLNGLDPDRWGEGLFSDHDKNCRRRDYMMELLSQSHSQTGFGKLRKKSVAFQTEKLRIKTRAQK